MEAAIGIFGGSGFYEFLTDVDEVTIDTPFGQPSAPVAIGSVAGRRVAFIPRHGPGHTLPPSEIPALANVWAMRSLGVTALLGPCAVGSLQPEIHPGDFVVLDQLVDRTKQRPDTFFGAGRVHHTTFADPYSPVLRDLAIAAGRTAGVTIHPTGTIVVIEGPRFSTRAESIWFRRQGWHVVGMTQYPEAYLAREAGMHYAGIALVTDYDTGADHDASIEPVTQEQVFAVLEENVRHVRDLLLELVPTLPAELEPYPTGPLDP